MHRRSSSGLRVFGDGGSWRIGGQVQGADSCGRKPTISCSLPMLKSAFWLGKFWLGKVVVKGGFRIRWLARWLVVLRQQMFMRKKRNSSDRVSIVILWFLIVLSVRRVCSLCYQYKLQPFSQKKTQLLATNYLLLL
ncbi:hypothetical protein PVAP13_6KG192900 [Panicum virgatum]|uniref:Transmembrane protein n=1 Tax=Panicum virgatum TaxID=38727 RepID=A0A8T0RCU6_PANVG|nr:hypothetical protein PVAP13_6KG192900 [Panicum virgatum]